ncbi:MAG TPA: SpoIID/LytB domain-containing protein [Candidatus Deferrimicrobiaceae bacterium]|nr:SpoIID/LytB domain-containing protein [Candidatus Deferrimicrobiaceae bacterium]
MAMVGALLALALLGWAGPALAAGDIRVAIADGLRTVEVGGGPMMISDLTGRAVVNDSPTWLRATLKGGGLEVSGGGRRADGLRLAPGDTGFLRVNGREYPGALEIVRSGDTLTVINELPLEEYLAGAVKAEAGDKMPLEMLKAQAVVARTYAAYHRRLNAEKAFHIVASTLNQQYLGRVAPDSAVWAAVKETAGQVLLWNGELFPAFYHTDSGGHTEDPRVVFATSGMPALRPVRVAFPSGSPHERWRLDLPLAELSSALLRGGISVGRVVALDVLERSTSLRVARIAVRGTAGTVTLRGNDLRRLVGYDTLKSTLFAVAVAGPVARFVGRGYGHGVGLDQWSAKAMADRGWSAAQIVGYYYPGAALATLPDSFAAR